MLKIKRSHFGHEFDHLSLEAMKYVRNKRLKTRNLDKLLRFDKLLKTRKERIKRI